MKRRLLILLFVSVTIPFMGLGCDHPVTPDSFTEAMEFPGPDGEWVTVDTTTLNYGKEQYMLYCYACHGEQGDGRGPASRWLRPPPRDFRTYTFKFSQVSGDPPENLPTDEILTKIIKDGLHGTAMLKWDIPDKAVQAIVHYIKTFSPEGEGFKDEEAALGKPVVPGVDPWAGKTAAAIARGKELYHAYECWSCHPAYAAEAEISAASKSVKNVERKSFRPNLYDPESKPTAEYTVAYPNAPKCGEDAENEECPDPKNQVCRLGECEKKLRVRPPDFTMDDVRVSHTAAQIFATLTAGIAGPMPAWTVVSEEDRWAVSHFVHSLYKLKDTPAAIAQKQALRKTASPESK